MAQKVLVQLVDDLDGTSSQDVSTVLFGLDGVSYEIDLSDTNAERLRESLQEFVDSARRTGGRIKRDARLPQSSKSTSSGEAGQIREWALDNGSELAGRGPHPHASDRGIQGDAGRAQGKGRSEASGTREEDLKAFTVSSSY
jgi:hypothetical protein